MNHQNGSDFLVFQEVLDPFGEFPEMPRWRAMPRYIHMLRDGNPAGWCPSTLQITAVSDEVQRI
jgi:hypothetical protein